MIEMYGAVDRLATTEWEKNRKIARFLAGPGNLEDKGILLAAMKPEEEYTERDLNYLFIRTQGDYIVRGDNSHQIAAQYCDRSLIPSGLVKARVVDINGKKRKVYSTTKEGQNEGLGRVGHFLTYSSEHTPSLQQLLGGTQHSFAKEDKSTDLSHVPPFNRYKLLSTLISANLPISTATLARLVNRDRTGVSQHLRDLKKAGLVIYDEEEFGKPVLKYRLSVNGLHNPPAVIIDDKNLGPRTRLAHRIYEVTYENEFRGDADWLTAERTTEIITARDEYFANYDKRRLKKTVGNIYKRLEKNGKVEIFDPKKASFLVDLSEPQRVVISEFINMFDRCFQGEREYIEDGKKKAHQIINDENKVQALVKKAKETSPYTKPS